jgi:16S rRNA (adenine1518-N6/adenine1519-N6)-dimethyltransferase
MPDKSLGQHWLTDKTILSTIVDYAEIQPSETVLEIGPGLGTMTSHLLKKAHEVVAIEIDHKLALKLPRQFPGKNLTVLNRDFLDYDLDNLPTGYKVVANVPYYITSKIIKKLMTSKNKPSRVVLLIQKEVAQRLAAEPGDMSILSISAQIYAEVSLGIVVGAQYFTPPPKVDSQVVILKTLSSPLVGADEEKAFFRLVKAGFSAKRKMLRSSLAGGLRLEKSVVEQKMLVSNVEPNRRAESLSIADWKRMIEHFF